MRHEPYMHIPTRTHVSYNNMTPARKKKTEPWTLAEHAAGAFAVLQASQAANKRRKSTGLLPSNSAQGIKCYTIRYGKHGALVPLFRSWLEIMLIRRKWLYYYAAKKRISVRDIMQYIMLR